MSTRIRLTVFVLLLALTSCAARNELQANKQKWATQNVTHYKFDLTISCLCPWNGIQPFTVEVKDGQVISITDKNGQPIPANYAKTFNEAATIEKLFGIVDSAIGTASKVTVEYDADYSYPKSIRIDYSKSVMDDEIGYYVNNFEALK
jgi:hypothetical protein